MRVEGRRGGRPELPRAVRRPAEPFEDVDGEVLRLLGGGAIRGRDVTLTPFAGRADPAALAALAALLPALSDEDGDARALEALDPAGRALMAPRLAAVRRMAETLRALLDMRAEVESRRRAHKGG